MYNPACLIQRLAEVQTLGTGRCSMQAPGTGTREAGGVWWVVFGGQHVACSGADGGRRKAAEIITSVVNTVKTLS
jgi:hypothetical protein